MNEAYTIALKQNQYPTYILSDREAGSRLEVVPERGGIITGWRIQGQDILYFDAERFANPELSIRGGIPILFPICGNLPENLYVHQGQSYKLKQHGFARDMPWEFRESSTDELASITLVLNSDENTLKFYPFEFELKFTYQIQGHRLLLKQHYSNQSSETMPFATGFHPYFQILEQNKSQLEFEIPAKRSQDQNTKETQPFKNHFDFDRDEIDVALFPLKRNSASMTNPVQKFKITLTYSDIFTTLVFWTVKDKDYCCLEPWSSPRNALNSKENLVYLEPGESCEATVELSVSY
ncbi:MULTISPECIES: aldose epimerase [Spirulina sp. CCY15215]|uniref:aldose epimerase family protein n=1 Tax=Spirulina sp. CCY15215 TaxID=2767591 RepID=UPI001951FA3C|nr:aldose epimerase [Spirulina major]